MLSHRFFIRNLEVKPTLESFLVSAVIAFLGIRVYLTLTHFPQIGGRNLHISHMLFGGALMAAAIIARFIYLNKSLDRPIAIIAGLGFGTFIDELGKFITRDNNYFFKPTFAIIYLIFVLLYLYFQYFTRLRKITQIEYISNSLTLLQDAVINDLDEEEKKRALLYLKQANQVNPLTKAIQRLFTDLETVPSPSKNILSRFSSYLHASYTTLIEKESILLFITFIFIIQSVINIFFAFQFILNSTGHPFPFFAPTTEFTVSQTLHLFSSAFSGLLVLIGVMRLHKDKLFSYRLFKRGLLISILVSQVFAFYINALAAFAVLLFNVILLVTINYMIEQETEKEATAKKFEG